MRSCSKRHTPLFVCTYNDGYGGTSQYEVCKNCIEKPHFAVFVKQEIVQ
tara:strand:+ start:93 stop:239 length:147 start_codon:yes stop_codon:yes gene_type:complete